MYTKRLTLLGLLLFALTYLPLRAQESSNPTLLQRVESYIKGDVWQYDSLLHVSHNKLLFDLGTHAVSDSYLSPITHAGTSFGVKLLRDGSRHIHQDLSGSFAMLRNPATTLVLHHFGLHYAVGPLWRLTPKRFLVVDAGVLWSTYAYSNLKLSNTNNVFTLRASTGLDAMLRFSCRLDLWGYPIHWGYTAQSSLLHFAFAPEYGQSYYDFISVENRQPIKLAFALPHHDLLFTQRLVADLPIHNTTLTLGVEHTYMRQAINSQRYLKGGLSFLVGLSFDSFTLGGGRSMRSPSIRNTYYQ